MALMASMASSIAMERRSRSTTPCRSRRPRALPLLAVALPALQSQDGSPCHHEEHRVGRGRDRAGWAPSSTLHRERQQHRCAALRPPMSTAPARCHRRQPRARSLDHDHEALERQVSAANQCHLLAVYAGATVTRPLRLGDERSRSSETHARRLAEVSTRTHAHLVGSRAEEWYVAR